jgi:hypothetical protein
MYKLMFLTTLAFFLLTMTLVPLYSSMVTVKVTKASQERLSPNAPRFQEDGAAFKQ